MAAPVAIGFALSLSLTSLLAQDATTKNQEQMAPSPEIPASTKVPSEVVQAKPPAPAREAFPLLDDGLLDPAWFGGPVSFQAEKEIDFFWMKPGFNLSGRQMRLKIWDPPVLLAKDRDAKDAQKARELTYLFPIVLRNNLNAVLAGKVKFSSTEGEVTVLGRFVDVNAGSENTKFWLGLGAGSATATWDLKIVDAKTNELLVAVHHRVVSASAFSGIQDKLEKWTRKFGQFLNDRAF